MELPRFEKEKNRKLPLYLKGSYDLFSGHLSSQKVLWAVIKSPESPTPDQLTKQSRAIQDVAGNVPIVFVFDGLDTWQRKRLIEKKIGFVEPFRQMYIPQLFMQIKEGSHQPVEKIVAAQHQLKPPAQLLLLYHLQVKSLEGLPFQEIAQILQYSPMSITRSIQDLHSLGLLKVEGSKEKSLLFGQQGRELWEQALPYLASPVRETWYSDETFNINHLQYGGETALSHYSLLADAQQKCYVAGKEIFRFSKSNLDGLHKKFGNNMLQVWHYDPAVLSKGKAVDRLSLYLTMKDHEDERIQASLRQIMHETSWL